MNLYMFFVSVSIVLFGFTKIQCNRVGKKKKKSGGWTCPRSMSIEVKKKALDNFWRN